MDYWWSIVLTRIPTKPIIEITLTTNHSLNPSFDLYILGLYIVIMLGVPIILGMQIYLDNRRYQLLLKENQKSLEGAIIWDQFEEVPESIYYGLSPSVLYSDYWDVEIDTEQNKL